MKFFQCPDTHTMRFDGSNPNATGPVSCSRSQTSIKPVRNVHFPNDIVFQDYVRQGDLERIGRFIRTRRVRLDTIYHSGRKTNYLYTELSLQWKVNLCSESTRYSAWKYLKCNTDHKSIPWSPIKAYPIALAMPFLSRQLGILCLIT